MYNLSLISPVTKPEPSDFSFEEEMGTHSLSFICQNKEFTAYHLEGDLIFTDQNTNEIFEIPNFNEDWVDALLSFRQWLVRQSPLSSRNLLYSE